jgi:hypothetical protein
MPDKSVKEIWRNTWSLAYKRNQIIWGTAINLVIVFTLPIFFKHIEKRNGPVLNDWLLAQISPHNVSVAIFAVIWGMVLLTMYRALYNPYIYILYACSLIPILILRFTSISLVALDPPKGLIPLTDPLTGVFYGQALITKDLFFSGHTATLTLLFLCLEKRSDKIISACAILTVACLLIVQHIHYTVDILAAPIITYACNWVTRRYLRK